MENKRENKERPKAEIEKNTQSELWNGVYDARLLSSYGYFYASGALRQGHEHDIKKLAECAIWCLYEYEIHKLRLAKHDPWSDFSANRLTSGLWNKK